MSAREFCDLVAAIDRGELPRAAAIQAGRAVLRRGSPGHARGFRRFERWLAAAVPMLGERAVWRLAALGLAEPAELLPRRFAEARATLARLRGVPRSSRSVLLHASRAPAPNPALVEILIAEARRSAGEDLAEAHAWLDLGEQQLARLQGAGFPEPALGMWGVRLLAHRANVFRQGGELRAAEAIFTNLGTDPRPAGLARLDVRAELLSLEGSLRTSLREFRRAEELLATAGSLYSQIGDPSGLAKTLLQRGSAANYAGDSRAAVARFREAAALLDPVADARLYLMSQHNLANNLVQLGEVREAAALMAAHRALYDAHAEPANRMRRRWVEGKIARAEGRWDDAERLLSETRDACLALGMAYDAALACLDLADLHLATGRTAEVQRLARQMRPIFASQGVHREALAALLLFRKAAARRRLTATFLARLRRYLLQARHDPGFRFADGAAG